MQILYPATYIIIVKNHQRDFMAMASQNQHIVAIFTIQSITIIISIF